jgi:hypothetical protein
MPLVNVKKMREIVARKEQLAKELRAAIPPEAAIDESGTDEEKSKRRKAGPPPEKHPNQVAAETHEQAIEQLRQFL